MTRVGGDDLDAGKIQKSWVGLDERLTFHGLGTGTLS